MAHRHAGRGRPRDRLPFGWHQAVDLVIAVALGDMALHLRGGSQVVLLGGAGFLVTLVLLSRGPLGVLRWLPPRVHLVLDLLTGGALVAGEVIVPDGRTATGIVIAAVAALVLARLAFTTNRGPAGRPAASEPQSPGAGGLSSGARLAGQLAGRAAGRGGVSPRNPPLSAQAGRIAGRAVQAGRRAADPERVGQVSRRAGFVAGRLRRRPR